MKFLIAFFIALSLTIAWQTSSLAEAEGGRQGFAERRLSVAPADMDGSRLALCAVAGCD